MTTILRVNDKEADGKTGDFLTRRIHASFAGRLDIHYQQITDDKADVVVSGKGVYLSIPITQITSLTGETIR